MELLLDGVFLRHAGVEVNAHLDKGAGQVEHGVSLGDAAPGDVDAVVEPEPDPHLSVCSLLACLKGGVSQYGARYLA